MYKLQIKNDNIVHKFELFTEKSETIAPYLAFKDVIDYYMNLKESQAENGCFNLNGKHFRPVINFAPPAPEKHNITTAVLPGINNNTALEVDNGTSFDNVLNKYNITIAIASLDNGTRRNLDINWDTDSYSSTIAGTYVITGSLILDDDLTNNDNITVSITVTVKELVQEEPKKNIKSVQSIVESVNYNTAFNDIGLPDTVVVTLDDNTTTNLSVTWNSSSYVSTQSGSQTIIGTLTLTDNVTNTDNLTATATITVSDNISHLTNSYYKMYDVYPDTYNTMTEVPDALNTSNLTTMNEMFMGCRSLTSIPELDTNRVTDMSRMLYNCKSITTIPQLNTSNVTDMNSMFQVTERSSLTSLDLSNWDTSKVTNMSFMFVGQGNLTNLNVSTWNTSNVTNMQYMFSTAAMGRGFTSLDLSSWDTSKVTNMYGMFYYQSNLTTLIVGPKWTTKNVTNMYGMFDSCTSLPATFPWTIDCSSILSANNMKNMFINSSVTLVRLFNVKQELRSQITSQLLKGDDTLEIIFVDSLEEPTNSDDWSLQFTLSTVQSELTLDSIEGFSDKETPSLEDFYGPDYDNVGRHLEIRYLGTQGHLDYAPDGVAVPNGCSSEEEIAAAVNPDGYADYDPDARSITFSGGSAGVKVYMLVYHSEAF